MARSISVMSITTASHSIRLWIRQDYSASGQQIKRLSIDPRPLRFLPLIVTQPITGGAAISLVDLSERHGESIFNDYGAPLRDFAQIAAGARPCPAISLRRAW